MSTLRLFTHIGKNARLSSSHQLTTQIFAFTPVCWNSHYRNNYSAFGATTETIPIPNHRNRRRCPPEQEILLHRSALLSSTKDLCLPNYLIQRRYISNKSSPDHAGKTESKSSAAVTNDEIFGESSKLGLFAKFKLMYKKYWYVLIPVHIVTSIGWFGGFYYLSQSGVDIASLLHQLHVSETIIEKVKNSSMGHLAIAYLCYKIATPLRYAVTLGGTTVSIKYLVQAGHIKPMPTKRELIDMYEQKKADRAASKEKGK